MRRHNRNGFTLLEMMVVFAIIGLLLTLATPRYFKSIEHSKEVALHHDLSVIREAIGHFYGDTNHYPVNLSELVQRRYLKEVPIDPVTNSTETWVMLPPPDNVSDGMFDIQSGAEGLATDGTPFKSF